MGTKLTALPMLGAAVGIAIVVTILGALVGVGMVIVNLLRSKGGLQFDFKSILRVYVYVVSFATLLVMAFGLSQAFKASFSYAAGYQFSYRPEQYYDRSSDSIPGKSVDIPAQVYENNDLVEIKGNKYYINKKQPLRDLVTGFTLFGVAAVLFVLHRLALRLLHEKDLHQSMLHRGYMLVNLLLFSVLGIVSIPTAIYQYINYVLVDSNQLANYSSSLPGEAIGVALAVTPLWIWFLISTVRMYQHSRKG